MRERRTDASCSPQLNKISEHDFMEDPDPPVDPIRGGIDGQLFALFRKNYDISKFESHPWINGWINISVSVIADIDRTDSPLVARARISAAPSARDSSP